jgi:hypothetical protein
VYRRQRRAQEPGAKANNVLSHPYTLHAVHGCSSDASETEQNGRSMPQKATCSTETGHDNDNIINDNCFPWASNESQDYDKNDTSDLATTDSEPMTQPPDSQDRRRDIRDHNTGFEEDQYHTHVPVRDDRGDQDEEGSVVPPQAQESLASMPSLSVGESDNEYEPDSTKPSTQPPVQDQINLQYNTGRRRRCDTADKDGCSPIVRSDAEQGKDEDVVRPPRRKRCRVNTSASLSLRRTPMRQTRLSRINSQSLQAPRLLTRDLERHQSQPSISNPRSSGGSALEEETVKAAFANFEGWPLEAVVLKRVRVGEVATFQFEFTWNPCTNHGRNDHIPETPWHKLPMGRISSMGRALFS